MQKDNEQTSDFFDEMLLAVVGILDEVKLQDNVASWIRTGGLWAGFQPQSPSPSYSPPSPGRSIEESRGDALPDDGEPQHGSPGNDANTADAHELPSGDEADASSLLWFDNYPTYQYWIQRGRQSLDALGIPIRHGVSR